VKPGKNLLSLGWSRCVVESLAKSQKSERKRAEAQTDMQLRRCIRRLILLFSVSCTLLRSAGAGPTPHPSIAPSLAPTRASTASPTHATTTAPSKYPVLTPTLRPELTSTEQPTTTRPTGCAVPLITDQKTNVQGVIAVAELIVLLLSFLATFLHLKESGRVGSATIFHVVHACFCLNYFCFHLILLVGDRNICQCDPINLGFVAYLSFYAASWDIFLRY